MAKQNQRLITAQHAERTDKNGNPQRKKFTERAWNNIPMTHFMSKEGITKRVRQGWVEVGENTGAKAPDPLKKPTEQQAPRPIPTPAPRPPSEV
jgi:hypothetical protein